VSKVVRKLGMHGYTFVIGDFICIIRAMFTESRESARSTLVITPNLSIWGSIEKNSHLDFIKKESIFHLPDGWPIALALSIKYGEKIRRIAGSDLLPCLFSYCSMMKYRMAIIGGHEEYESKLTKTLFTNNLSPNFRIFDVSVQSQHSPMSNETIADIQEYHPDVIVICLGFPKQEFLGVQLKEYFAVPILCLGASLDFLITPKLRAPNLVISMKMEWLWRFMHEPRRLFNRYFSDALFGIRSLIKAMFT